MANSQESKIEGQVVKAFTFVGKLAAMTVPVVAGIYMVRFLDRKVFKNKYNVISE